MSLPLRKDLARPVQHGPLLRALREAARETRCAARLDAARACRLIGPGITPDAAIALLVRVLPLVVGHRMRIRPVDAEDRSFDENWILALLRAEARGDRDSLRFLLGRRCGPDGAARMTELIRMMVPHVSE